MNIFICRHAQVHNPEKIIYRRLPGFHLSKQGEVQAKEMGLFFKKHQIKEILTSPMKRCVQTAEIIKKTIDNPIVEIYQKDYLNEWDKDERTANVVERMKFVLKDKKNNYVYVSHKDPIRVFLNEITNQSLPELDSWDCPLGTIYRITIGKRISAKLVFTPGEVIK